MSRGLSPRHVRKRRVGRSRGTGRLAAIRLCDCTPGLPCLLGTWPGDCPPDMSETDVLSFRHGRREADARPCVRASGLVYLRLATQLLQRFRRADTLDRWRRSRRRSARTDRLRKDDRGVATQSSFQAAPASRSSRSGRTRSRRSTASGSKRSKSLRVATTSSCSTCWPEPLTGHSIWRSRRRRTDSVAGFALSARSRDRGRPRGADAGQDVHPRTSWPRPRHAHRRRSTDSHAEVRGG